MPFSIVRVIGPIRIAGLDLLEVDAGGEGNCLFNAIGLLLQQLRGYRGSHERLRNGAVDWIRALCLSRRTVTPDETTPLLAPERTVLTGMLMFPDLCRRARLHILANQGQNLRETDDPTDEGFDRDVERYLTAMAISGTWGDVLCIHALEQLFNIRIEVYDKWGHATSFPSVSTEDASLTLRLIARARHGYGPVNHFNALIDPDSLERVPRRPIAPIVELEDLQRYWGKSVIPICPYAPPIFHAQFDLRPPSRRFVISRVITSLFNTTQTNTFVPRVTGVQLLNLLSGKTPSVSPSFVFSAESKSPVAVIWEEGHKSDLAAAMTVDTAFRMPFMLPLAHRTPDKVSSLCYHPYPDSGPESIRLKFSLRECGSAYTLCFNILTRVGKLAKPVCRIEHNVFGLILALLRNKHNQTTFNQSEGRYDFDIPLNVVIAEEEIRELNWRDGPYMLLVSIKENEGTGYLAWTYFNVPSPWDIQTLECVHSARVLMLRDDLEHARAIEGAQITSRTKKAETPIRLTPEEEALALHACGQMSITFDTNTLNFLEEREDGSWFAGMSWASVLVCRRVEMAYYARRLYCYGDKRRLIGIGDFGEMIYTPEPRIVPIATSMAGQECDILSDWKCYDLEESLYPLSCAVTTGISACAGGMTFSNNEGDPEWLVFWHIDANVSVPVRHAIEWIRSIDVSETSSSFRTMVSVFPNPWELEKYRAANLYPEEIVKDCQTIFMPRGAHLYSDKVAVGCGHELFGLQFVDGSVNLVCTYEFDSRLEVLRSFGHREADSDVSITLRDYDENIFGSYHIDTQDIPRISTPRQMRQYVGLLNRGDMQVTRDKRAHQRVLVIPRLGRALFAAVLKTDVCVVIAELPCLFLGEKAEFEFSTKGEVSKRWDHSHLM